MNVIETRFVQQCAAMQEAFSDVEPTIKTCPTCGTNMEGTHYRKQYCSRQCAKKASRIAQHKARKCYCKYCD